METITLQCWVYRDDVENVFPVEISKDKTVGILKEIIKEKTPEFRDVAAKDLRLYSIPIPGDDDEHLKDELKWLSLEDKSRLNARTKVSKLFLEFDEGQEEWLIIVDVPPPAVSSAQPDVFTLNCLLHGGRVEDIFSVQISSTQTVGLLKKAVKNELAMSFHDVDTGALHLYSIPLPNDKERLSAELEKLMLHEKPCLDPRDQLSSIFPSFNQYDLHIIVRASLPAAPTAVRTRTSDEGDDDVMTELDQRFRRTCHLRSRECTPSVAAKSIEYMKIQGNEECRIFDGRYAHNSPADTNGPPIQLFNPAFAYFSSKAFDPDYDVPLDFIRNVRDLMNDFSAIHPRESGRASHLKPRLERVLGRPLTNASNADKTTPDALVLSSYEHLQIYLTVGEQKNEFGDGGSDPSVQASFSFLRVYKQEEAERLREQCCCPTFLIAHAGPWLAVLGGIITSECIVQRLTDFIWIPVHSAGDDDQYLRIGRVLYALKESISQLEKWYATTLKTVEAYSPSHSHPRFFPTPNMYLRDGMPVKFKYLRPLERYTSCMTYLASTLEDQPIKVVVKFVTKYGEDAHHEMATGGFAPKLLYCGPVNVDDKMPSYGKLKMVVMDCVEGLPLHRAKDMKLVPPDFYAKLKKAIEWLHRKDFVFGDLRQPNIMIAQEGQKVQLIDFDWAGKEGEVRYPVSISSSISWADGVKGLELIHKQHDLAMLESMRSV